MGRAVWAAATVRGRRPARSRCLAAGTGGDGAPCFASRGEAMHGERGDRRADGGDRRRVAREKLQQVIENLRIALLDIAHDLLDLARRRARGVLQRHRNLRPPGMRRVLGERAAAHDCERERADRGEQPAEHAGALPKREAIERRGDDRGKCGWRSGSAAHAACAPLIAGASGTGLGIFSSVNSFEGTRTTGESRQSSATRRICQSSE